MSDHQQHSKPSPADVAREIFLASTHYAFRSLECEFNDGVLTISGQLPSYHEKQLALSSVRAIQGVQRVDIRIAVNVQESNEEPRE